MSLPPFIDLMNDLHESLLKNGFSASILSETSAGATYGYTRFQAASSPIIYLSSGLHGDEPAGPSAVIEMAKRGFRMDCNWIICPALNPVGLNFSKRENAQGDDMNRDYLMRMSYEVANHVKWLEARPVPNLFISLHEDWESTGYYFYEVNSGWDIPGRAVELLNSIRSIMPIEPSYEIDGFKIRELGWIYHDYHLTLEKFWPEAVYFAKRGCTSAFTLESPSSYFPLETRVSAHIAAVDFLAENLLNSVMYVANSI